MASRIKKREGEGHAVYNTSVEVCEFQQDRKVLKTGEAALRSIVTLSAYNFRGPPRMWQPVTKRVHIKCRFHYTNIMLSDFDLKCFITTLSSAV